MKRRNVAFSIALLFLLTACSPILSAHEKSTASDTRSIPTKDDSVSMMVLECRSDGSLRYEIVSLTMHQASALKEASKIVTDAEGRLSLYKKFGLIPDTVSLENLRSESDESIKTKYVDSIRFFKQNLGCEVTGDMDAWSTYFIGRPLLNLRSLLLIADLLPQYIFERTYRPGGVWFKIFTLMGEARASHGRLPDFYCYGIFGSISLVGFCGYFIWSWEINWKKPPVFPIIEFTGTAAYVKISGLFMEIS